MKNEWARSIEKIDRLPASGCVPWGRVCPPDGGTEMTISQKQLEANRQNAKLGGVKTEGGKAVSKLNALKHGLLSQEVLLEGEKEKLLIELGRRLREFRGHST